MELEFKKFQKFLENRNLSLLMLPSSILLSVLVSVIVVPTVLNKEVPYNTLLLTVNCYSPGPGTVCPSHSGTDCERKEYGGRGCIHFLC